MAERSEELAKICAAGRHSSVSWSVVDENDPLFPAAAIQAAARGDEGSREALQKAFAHVRARCDTFIMLSVPRSDDFAAARAAWFGEEGGGGAPES